MSGPFPKSKITRYSLILLNLPPTSRLIPFQTFPANSTSVWSGWRRFSAVQPPRFFRFHRTHSVTLWRVPIWVKRSRSAPKSHPATTPHVPSTESARFRPVDEAGRASFTHLSMWSSFALNLAFFSSADRVPARDVLMVGPAAPLLRNCRTGEKAGRKYCYVTIGTREGPRTGRICDLSLWRGCRTSPRLGLLQSGGNSPGDGRPNGVRFGSGHEWSHFGVNCGCCASTTFIEVFPNCSNRGTCFFTRNLIRKHRLLSYSSFIRRLTEAGGCYARVLNGIDAVYPTSRMIFLFVFDFFFLYDNYQLHQRGSDSDGRNVT